MAKVIGIDLGTTNSVVAVVEGGDPGRHPQHGGPPPHALGRRVRQGGGDPGRPGGEAPGHHEPGEHRLLHQAIHGPPVRRGAPRDQARALQGREGAERGRARRHPRQAARAAGDLRDDPAQAQGGRRGLPGREGHEGGHHRPRVLQRQPAPGDQGRRDHRRARSAPDRERADGGGAGVRARQEEGRDDRGLRPRRRHLRRLDPRDRRRRLRGEGDERRHAPGR